MKITLESTTKIVTVNGVPCRIWEGTTERGVAIHAYVTRVAVDRNADASELERDLQECRTPSVDVGALPSRLVL